MLHADIWIKGVLEVMDKVEEIHVQTKMNKDLVLSLIDMDTERVI